MMTPHASLDDSSRAVRDCPLRVTGLANLTVVRCRSSELAPAASLAAADQHPP